MKKSIFLFFAAILCAIGMNAATVTSDGTARLYFNLKAVSWWNAGTNGNGNFGYFFNNSTGKNAWSAHAVKHSGDTYYLVIPKGTWAGVILTRNNTSTAPSWDNKWNQTGDITLSSTSNYISKFSEGSATVTWGTAVKPASNAAVSAAASTIFVGASTTLTSSLTSNTNLNTVKSATYSTTSGASISGNTFTASTAGTYTVTATVTYHPNGYPSITSTATATTTITVEVPAEETHDVTISYMCGETKIAEPTTANTVGVETPVKVTAPEIAKYTFANWTLGADVATTDALTSNEINITTKAGGSDFTLVANYEKAKLTYTVTVPAGTENCYLVGAMNGWDEKNPYEMTKQSENVFTVTLEGVEKTDEYKYLSQKGTWDYEEVGGNRTWTANDVVTAWKDPLATGLYLRGSMNGWGTTDHLKKATKEATTATVTIALEAKTSYTLKVANSDWSEEYGTGSFTATATVKLTSKGNDVSLKTTAAGDYVFTWEMSTKKLTVTYPTLYAVTATANDAAMGTIAGAGEYGKGSTATLTATPNDGYLFVNWTKGSEEVSTDATYSFKVEEAVELVANFKAAPEEVHNVTVSYVCGGNKIAEDQTVAAVGVTTPKTAEAPAIFGYTFTSWTLGADVTSTNELTSNTIDINIVAGGSDYTLTANYTEIPKVKIYVVNNKKWSKVNVYGWKDGEAQGTPAWPGQDITANKETEQVAGFDVYSYSVVPGSYDNLILNNGSGEQTGTYKWTDGKYYYVGATENYAGGTAEEVATALAPVTKYYIAGTENLTGYNWSANGLEMTKDGDVYKHTFSELNSGIYQFKITDGQFNTEEDKTHEHTTLGAEYEEVSYNEGNIKIVTEEAINLTVIFNAATDKITFEGLTKVTHTYTVAGSAALCGVEWKWEATENDMTNKGDGTYTWTKVGVKVNGELSFKVFVDHKTEKAYPENDWVIKPENYEGVGVYDVTITFTESSKEIAVALTKQAVVTPEVYTRTVTEGNYGTICLPYASSSYSGAEFYEVSWLQKNGETPVNLYLDQLAAGTQLEAGKPYIFRATSTELTVTYTDDAPVADPVAGKNGLTGSFDAISAGGVLTGNYVVAQNKFWTATATAYADENRAYIDKEKVPDTEQKQIPGRRRVSLGAAGENAETGIDNIITTDTPVKVIENGQLIIIRNGEKFNVQGQKL